MNNSFIAGYFTGAAAACYIEVGFKPTAVEAWVSQTNPDIVMWQIGDAEPGGRFFTGTTGVVTLVTTTGVMPYAKLPVRAADTTHFKPSYAANSAGDERVYAGHIVVTDALVATVGHAFYGLGDDDFGGGFSVSTSVTSAATILFRAWR